MSQLVIWRILAFWLASLVILLLLMTLQLVRAQKDTLVEYEITGIGEYQSAIILKDSFKAHLKIEIGCIQSMTKFELWAWSKALREILIEMNRYRDNVGGE